MYHQTRKALRLRLISTILNARYLPIGIESLHTNTEYLELVRFLEYQSGFQLSEICTISQCSRCFKDLKLFYPSRLVKFDIFRFMPRKLTSRNSEKKKWLFIFSIIVHKRTLQLDRQVIVLYQYFGLVSSKAKSKTDLIIRRHLFNFSGFISDPSF